MTLKEVCDTLSETIGDKAQWDLNVNVRSYLNGRRPYEVNYSGTVGVWPNSRLVNSDTPQGLLAEMLKAFNKDAEKGLEEMPENGKQLPANG